MKLQMSHVIYPQRSFLAKKVHESTKFIKNGKKLKYEKEY